jgi:superfamily II DNA helicase RecQ
LLAQSFPTAAYHAGLDAEKRRRVQDQFLNGKLEVIVATIAFGMGIDKANIRSVMHTALPGSVEAYYQEIGRAGRDGEPSRAILMHSYADRYTHDFFFERDYPDMNMLDQIHARLRAQPQPREVIEKQSRVPGDGFEKALEKLWAHGGVKVDAGDNLSLGTVAQETSWRDSYIAQGAQKAAQIEAMIRYSQSNQCRMSSLVRHFGDTADSRTACGVCDFCAPQNCVAQRFRVANAAERALAMDVLKALESGARPMGKLHAELCSKNGMDRDSFEELIGAMARAGVVRLVEAVFEKDGKPVPYRKATLTREADWYLNGDMPLDLAIRTAGQVREKTGRARKKKGVAAKRPVVAKAAKRVRGEEAADSRAAVLLKEWRRAQAKKQGVPSFRIMSDRVLMAIAEDQPGTLAELLAIPGIGLKTVEKYGAQIYRILDQARG